MAVAGLTIWQALARRAAERPDAPFLVFEDQAGSITELPTARFAADVERLAAGLAGLGLRKGDRVLVQLPNGPEVATAMFAAGRLGAIVVPSNTANRVAELSHLVRTTEPRCLLVCDEDREVAHAALAEAGVRARVVICRDGKASESAGEVPYAALLDGDVPAPEVAVAATDPLQIMFSSGTTSRPKGVVATHANLLSSGRRQAMSYRMEPGDRLLTVLPLFHASAQSTTLFAALASGASAIFLERYSASRFWGQVRRHRTTRLTLVTMLLRTLLVQPPADTDRDHELRSVGYATNITEAAQAEFEERFGVTLTNAYGLTEAMTEVSIAPVDGPRRWPSVGVPTMDRKVRIAGEDDRELPRGEVGEIQVHGVPGETIMKEYWGDPAATARTLRDGWLCTRDMGWMDEHGYLYFSDRDVDLIKTGGENVSAAEVEALVLEHPDVIEVAVIGIPDPIRDELIKAVVVLRDGAHATADEIQAFCAERVSRFKVPAVVEISDRLPTNAVGKIDKKLLRQPA
jgi:crotonobetaine/carnitine-CoA ligase